MLKSVKNRRSGKTKIIKVVTLFIFVILATAIKAQDAGGNDQQSQSKDPPSSKAQRVQQKKQKEQEKKAEKERKAALEQHMKNQTPEVRKRMKQDSKEANRYNEHKREFFLKRWFTKKKP